jgi:hypothetical protein
MRHETDAEDLPYCTVLSVLYCDTVVHVVVLTLDDD